MVFARSQLDNLAQPIVNIFLQMEKEILLEIANGLSSTKSSLTVDSVTQWRLEAMEHLGVLDNTAIRAIRDHSGMLSGEVNELLYKSGLKGVRHIDDDLEKAIRKGARLVKPEPLHESPVLTDILKSHERNAKTTLNMTNQSLISNTHQTYIDAVNTAAFETSLGTKTGNQAIRGIINKWADSGIPILTDRAGRQRGVEGYVRMLMVTTSHKVANDMQDERIDDWGINLIEISSHKGNRPGCEPYAGKIFSTVPGNPKYPYIDDPTIGRKGDPDSLFGINCGHFKYPYIEGISIQRNTPNDPEQNKIDYEESQRQRVLERSIRNAKNRRDMLNKAGDTEGAKKAEQLMRNRQASIRKFIDETGRTRRYDREGVWAGPGTVDVKPKQSSMHFDKGADIIIEVDGSPIRGSYIGSTGSTHKLKSGVTGEIVEFDDKVLSTTREIKKKVRKTRKKIVTGGPIKTASKPTVRKPTTKKSTAKPVSGVNKAAAQGKGLQTFDKKVTKNIQNQEQKIRKLDYEKAAVYDKNGNLIWEKSGNKNSVDLSDAANKGVLRGNILTHNHPSNQSFSPADIKVLFTQDLQEIRAVGANGSLMRASRTSNKKLTFAELDEVERKIQSANNRIRKERQTKIIRGELEMDGASDNHWHEVWSNLKDELGIDYKRVKGNG